MPIVRSSVAAIACLGISLMGCAGSGAGLGSNGRPLGSGGGGGPLTANFQSIQDNVFTPICSVCHAGGAAPQGLRLDAANSYALLVGVPSTEESSILRIRPGDPNNSYLVQKIEGIAAVGAQMPFGGAPLPAATITTIRQWVSDGALQLSPPPQVMAFAVAAVAPATGDVVLEAPPAIVIAFNRELDRTRLDAGSLRLERLPIGRADEPESVPFALTVPPGNPAALLLTPRARLGNGVYRVLIPAAPATGVAAIDGARVGDDTRDSVVSVFAVEAAQ
jgi:hypothetical protein